MNKFRILMVAASLTVATTQAVAFWSVNKYKLSSVHQDINARSFVGYPFQFRGSTYYLSPAMLESLNVTTSCVDDDKCHTYDLREHFDSESLATGFIFLRERRKMLRDVLTTPFQTDTVREVSEKLLGYMLHQIQDFYSHTSYIERFSPPFGVPIIDFGAATSDPSAIAPVLFRTPKGGATVCANNGATLTNPGMPELTSGYYDETCKYSDLFCSNNSATTPGRCNHGDLKTAALDGCRTTFSPYVVVTKDGINKDSPCVTSEVDVNNHQGAADAARRETQSFVTAIVKSLQDSQNGPGFCTLLGLNPSRQICAPAKADQMPRSFVSGTPITAFSPMTDIGWGASEYKCEIFPSIPALPPGLMLRTIQPTPTSPGRCEVYGTPTEAAPVKSYTFRVSEVGGLALDSGIASNVSISVGGFSGTYTGQLFVPDFGNTTVIESAEVSNLSITGSLKAFGYSYQYSPEVPYETFNWTASLTPVSSVSGNFSGSGTLTYQDVYSQNPDGTRGDLVCAGKSATVGIAGTIEINGDGTARLTRKVIYPDPPRDATCDDFDPTLPLNDDPSRLIPPFLERK